MATLNPHAREQAVIRQLRETYEREGFEFFEYPQQDLVPSFFGSYRPDAIALRPDRKVAIEVKANSRSSEPRLVKISSLFRGQRDWELKVVFAESASPPQRLAPEPLDHLMQSMQEARQLAADGHPRAAMLTSWALLEACARRLAPDVWAQPGGARSVIEWLTSEGYIEQETAESLRALVPLRTAIVHGDLSQTVSRETVDTVLGVAASLVDENFSERAGTPSRRPVDA